MSSRCWSPRMANKDARLRLGWRKLREAQSAWDQSLKGTGFIENETVAIEYRLMTSLARPGATRTRPKRCGRSQVEVLDAGASREIEGAFATAFFCEPPNNSS